MRLLDKEFAGALRAVRDRGRGRADLRAAARGARRRPGAGLAQARVHPARAPPRHRRPLPAARALPRHPLRLQAGDGAPARAQLQDADEALRVRGTAAADPARARPCSTGRRRRSSSTSSRRRGTSTSRSTASPCARRPRSSWARATAAPAAAGSSTARSSPAWSEGPQRSNYRAVIDPEACIACGVCIERCPVDAIAERLHGAVGRSSGRKSWWTGTSASAAASA